VRGLQGEADLNRDGYITGTELAEYLKEKVTNYSNGSQTPQYGKISDRSLNQGDFVFAVSETMSVIQPIDNQLTPLKTDSNAAEKAVWEQINNSEKRSDYELFIKTFPKGIYAGEAKEKFEKIWWDSIKDSKERGDFEEFLEQIPKGKYAAAAQFVLNRLGTIAPTPGEIRKLKLPDGLELKFVFIPAGTFMMGSDVWNSNAQPAHQVQISKGFWMGQTEVTQAQWEALLGNNPSKFTGCPNCPVEQLSWVAVQQFIKKLNAANDGYNYRLPTEAEWEYACRAGESKLKTTEDAQAMGWYKKNSEGRTHEVGTKIPNAWGLYDMHGNVAEWVQDRFELNYYKVSPGVDPQGPASGSYRIYRGGGFSDRSYTLLPEYRLPKSEGTRDKSIGFRIVRTN
jgi:formylglycine-generating enzyme required for sulfatase activity